MDGFVIQYKTDMYFVSVDQSQNPLSYLLFDEEVVYNKMTDLPARLHYIKVQKVNSNTLKATIVDGSNYIVISISYGNWQSLNYMNIDISASAQFRGNSKGLCGTWDFSTANDYLDAYGNLISGKLAAIQNYTSVGVADNLFYACEVSNVGLTTAQMPLVDNSKCYIDFQKNACAATYIDNNDELIMVKRDAALTERNLFLPLNEDQTLVNLDRRAIPVDNATAYALCNDTLFNLQGFDVVSPNIPTLFQMCVQDALLGVDFTDGYADSSVTTIQSSIESLSQFGAITIIPSDEASGTLNKREEDVAAALTDMLSGLDQFNLDLVAASAPPVDDDLADALAAASAALDDDDITDSADSTTDGYLPNQVELIVDKSEIPVF